MNLELNVMTEIAARDALSDAIRYWEPRRILYNVVLLLVVAATYWANLPTSRSIVNADCLQVLFVLAVLANVAYCAAYVVDVIAQISAFRGAWRRGRWMLLVVGVLFAGVLAHFFSGGLFAHST
jgi:hypothetical protein